MNQNAICIAGAHRSGTSMLTRLLHRSGLDLGPENNLMPAAADNPDGFWENLSFVRLNDEILNAIGAAWDLPPWQKETFKGASLQPMRAKAQLLIESFQDKPVWGWKDPRNSLTLPFWRSLLPGLKTIIMIRNPLEVAYSMHQRNGTSYALGLRLWEIYNRRLLAETHPDNRVIVRYQTFFEEPEAELQKAATFAGLDSKEIAAAATLVAVQRRHTAFTTEQMIDAGVSREIVALYRSLMEGTAEPDNGTMTDQRASAVGGDQLSGAKSKLNASIPNSEDIRRELAARRGDEIRHREEIARFQKTIDGLREELTAKNLRATAEINRRDGRIEELQKAYTHLDQLLREEQTHRNHIFSELERARQEFLEKDRRAQIQLDRVGQELKNVRERFAQSNQLLQTTSVRLADFEKRNASLTEGLRKRLLEMKRLLRLLDQIGDAADLLRRSRRWKLANPAAAIRAVILRTPLHGFGHLDKNVEKYRSWRSAHPEANTLAEEIQALRPRQIFSAPPAMESESSSAPKPSTVTRPPPPTAPIKFPQHQQVDVSIVIPVYNQVDFTQACLAAVQQHSGEIPYEVIVVDDASTDATGEVIGRIPGITFLRAQKNAGFIAACNRGAAAARGAYLVFLNNDTTVTKGWLAALRETFEFAPAAGLVGSKLVYSDGRLQEAGGIIWRDGTGWNRGKFQDPDKPEYNYLREVDYCSAASIMITKSLFDSLGGFDSKYEPAYYEDTDLAFKVADSGLQVLYQPLSVVVHYEGITAGTDTSAGTKRYQEINHTIFTQTWAEKLAVRPSNGDVAAWEQLPEGAQRILVIDHHLPMADRDSGSLRMFQILTLLSQLGHRATFLPDNLADIPPYGDELRKRGIEVVHHPYVKRVEEYLLAEGKSFDLVVLSRRDFACKYIETVRRCAPQARVIFDTVDLHFLREEREADLTHDIELEGTIAAKRQLEYELIDRSDETWVVSCAEKELLHRQRPEKSIEVVSNIVPIPGSATPFELRRDILFIGSFQHTPNIDAAIFFVREIFPRLQAPLPDARFYIIGDKAPPEVIALATDEKVIVTGFQPNVSSYFDSIKLSVAPLRYGAGVKGKINQSMGFGVPVVATSLAAEGMRLTSERDIMIADEPAAFAEAVIRLYSSKTLWNQLSQNSIDKTRAFYSVDAARAQLKKLIGYARIRPHESTLKEPLSLPSERQTAA